MKKTRLFLTLTLTLILALTVLVGCGKKNNKITSISLKDYDPETAIEVALGEFDCSAYTLIASYSDGSTKEIPLTEDMIEDVDLFKLYQVGEHEIKISYEKQEYTLKISIKRSTMGDLKFPENNVFTYDGKDHAVEVEGDIPSNATISYPGGNSFVNAGKYDVTAIVSCDGYVTKKLSTTVTIEQAKYDLSKIKFDAKEFVYDGSAHSVAISGELPNDVKSPTYYIKEKATSSATDVGEYEVIARFTHSNPNYQPIPDMKTTLKITPATYTVKDVNIIFKGSDGKRIDGDSKIYDGTAVTFEIDNYNKISNKLFVSYSVLDKNGKVISNSNKTTNILNAGTYTARVEFTLSEGKNYNPIAPITSTFEVEKADYLLENVTLTSDSLTFDEKEHSLKVVGEVPKDVAVSYEYYLDDTLIVDGDNKPVKAVKNVGNYTVKAILSHTDENFKDIEPISASLKIEAATIDITTLGLTTHEHAAYNKNGNAIPIDTSFSNDITVRCEYYKDDTLITDGSGNPVTSVIGLGDYTVKLFISTVGNNYVYDNNANISITFTVNPFPIIIEALGLNSTEEAIFNEDGNAITVDTSSLPEDVKVSWAYYKDGALVTDESGDPADSVSAVGEYTVKFFIEILEEAERGNYSYDEDMRITFNVIEEVVEDSDRVENGGENA